MAVSTAYAAARFSRINRTLDKPRHALIVRSFPVDPIAVRADVKFVVTLPRVWKQAIVDQFFRYGPQRRAAAETPPKRSNQPREVEPVHDFNKLLP